MAKPTGANAKVGEAKEITLRVDDSLSFKDGIANKFAERMVGATQALYEELLLRRAPILAAR